MQILQNYNSNNLKESISFIVDIYNLVNGKINITKPVKGIQLIFKIGEGVAYMTSDNILNINPKYISCYNDRVKTIALDIICHELSHLNQTVDYNRYNNDFEYWREIESSNETNVYNFILYNKDIIEKTLGFEIQFDYILSVINNINNK